MTVSLDPSTENQQLRKQLAQLLQQAQQNQQILQRHQALDLELIGAGSFDELFVTIFHRFASTTALDGIGLALLDPDYEIRRILADLDVDLSEWPQLVFLQDESEVAGLPGRLSNTVLARYAGSSHGVLFPELTAPLASIAIVPLIRRGKTIGSLNMGSSDAQRFTQDMSTDFIERMASIVAVCLENVINTERLKHLGLTDPLTGVNNRRYVERRLHEEIGRSLRHGHELSCLYIDVDRFKQINDGIGHQAGDEVLRGVAARIKAELRLSDALGRFGGEEFVAVLLDARTADAVCVAERIRRSIAEQPVQLSSGQSLNVTASVGIASLSRTTDNAPIDTLAKEILARADCALYQAKNRGRNRVVAAD
jgi:diguanylate cyclase (GGDEF)-like protein